MAAHFAIQGQEQSLREEQNETMRLLPFRPNSMARWLLSLLFATQLVACHRPDVRMVSTEPTRMIMGVVKSPFSPTTYIPTKQIGFIVDNYDYGGNLFVRPGPVDGPLSVNADLSSNGILKDGAQVGTVRFMPTGGSLGVGQSWEGFFDSAFSFDEGHPFVVMTVVSGRTEWTLTNNSRSRLLGNAPLSEITQWLREHPGVMLNLKWEQSGGIVVDYEHWNTSLKVALQDHVNGIVSGAPISVSDPPALAKVPSGSAPAETTFTPATAQTIFLAHVARSIVSEQQLPWKVSELSEAELAHLFDSRRLFHWDAARGAYFRHWAEFGRATPGDPNTVYAFMQSHTLIGMTRLETIHKVLDWSRGLTHYLGGDSAANYVNHWQYAGDPPVARILTGTVRADDTFGHTTNYTAGCWGTSGLLWLMLRTVNIPTDFTTPGGHSLPHFMHEGLYLSHGDDPYGAKIRTSSWIPIDELPISTVKYNDWFGSDVTFDTQIINVGRRVCELDARYLSDSLVRQHCADFASGASHEASGVYSDLRKCYMLTELDMMNLWVRLDARAVERGFCLP